MLLDARPTGTAEGGRGTVVEAVRWLLTVLWVAALSFFAFYLYVWLTMYFGQFYGSLAVTGYLDRSLDPIWLTAALPALVSGMALHAASYLVSSEAGNISVRYRPSNVRSRIQAFSTLCLAFAFLAFMLRIQTVLSVSMDLASGHALGDLIGSEEGWSQLLSISVGASVLAVAVVFLQAIAVIRDRTARWRGTAAGYGMLTVGVLAVPLLSLYPHLRLPVPEAMWRAASWTGADRAILGAAGSSNPELQRVVGTYLETHDGAGQVVPWLRQCAAAFARTPTCEVCLLPNSIFLAPRGVTLTLASGAADPREPDLVIEIPRLGDRVRLSDPDRAEAPTVVDLEEFLRFEPTARWVVLKLDATLPEPFLSGLLAHLHDRGVTRATIAVWPVGFLPVPEHVSLRFDSSADEPSYRAKRVPHERSVIVVRKYVPPPAPGPPPPPTCGDVYCGDVREAVYDHVIPRPGSVPSVVRVDPRRVKTVQALVREMERAIAGGARTIVMDPEPGALHAGLRGGLFDVRD